MMERGNESTKARLHDCTMGRKHESTTARLHDGAMGRLHGGTSERFICVKETLTGSSDSGQV